LLVRRHARRDPARLLRPLPLQDRPVDRALDRAAAALVVGGSPRGKAALTPSPAWASPWIEARGAESSARAVSGETILRYLQKYFPAVHCPHIAQPSTWMGRHGSTRGRGQSLSRPGQPDSTEGPGAAVRRAGHRQRAGGIVRHAASVVRAAPRGARAEPADHVEEARARADL